MTLVRFTGTQTGLWRFLMVGPSRTAPLLVLTLALSACGGGSGSTGTPPTATPSPVVGGAFTCPTSETTFGLRTASAVADSAGRRPHHAPAPGPDVDPSLLAVTYDPRASVSEALDAKISAVHGNRVSDIAFDRSGSATRGVFVDASNRDAAAAALRLLPGVRDVSVVHRLHTLSTNRPDLVGPFITNDVIFAGNGVAPLYQTAATEGQWDMHVIGLEHAFDYSQPGNGSSVPVNANALGSTNIKLAVIDTGSDVTHSDLAAANIVRTQCYITGTNHAQSTGTFVTDPDGHGTNVAGIAGDAVNNNFGYAGAGGNISLMLYRVFPTPDSSCSTKSANPPPQCSTNTLDVASAINDAVANGANVINLSFGGDTACTNGQDPDQTEGKAIAGAIAANVIVVAASGNSGTPSVGAPACDTGVIAVGATGWND
ncbi:MAG: S8 family serine peptidase, partial [Candidatus Baltobacteraceae bacterium]